MHIARNPAVAPSVSIHHDAVHEHVTSNGSMDGMEKELLFIGSNGHVAAIDPETGAEAWRTVLSSGGLFATTTMADVTVIQHGDRVFAGCYGHLFCLDAATGTVIWQNGLKGMGYNDVTLSIGGKSVQFVSSHNHGSHT